MSIQQQRNFAKNLKIAIQLGNPLALYNLYKNSPHYHDISINGDNPLFYIVKLYLQNSTRINDTRLKMINTIIENSSHQDINEEDPDGDSIVAYIFNFTDYHIIYKILKKLVDYGFDINQHFYLNPLVNKFESLICFYLQVCYEDNKRIYKPIIRLMITKMSKEELTSQLWCILYRASLLMDTDLEYIIGILKDKKIKFPANNHEIINLILKKDRQPTRSKIRKLNMLLNGGLKINEEALVAVCSNISTSPAMLRFVVSEIQKHKQKNIPLEASKALNELLISYQNISPDIQLVRILCELGADMSYKNQKGNDIVATAMLRGNEELLNVIFSYASTNRLRQALSGTSQTYIKNIIQHNIGFRNKIKQAEKTITQQQQTNHPSKSRSLRNKFVSLPSDLRIRIRSMNWSKKSL